MSFKRIIIDAFIDENGAIQAGKIEFPTPGEVATATPDAPTGAIKLDPKAPNFDARRKDLKEKGYTYQKGTQTWFPPKVSGDQPQDFSNWFGNMTEVALDKSDPDFESKRLALKEAGFRWNKPKNLWVLANGNGDQPQDFSNWLKNQNEVKLDKSDPDFERKHAAVKAAGFKWSQGKKVWVRPSA